MFHVLTQEKFKNHYDDNEFHDKATKIPPISILRDKFSQLFKTSDEIEPQICGP